MRLNPASCASQRACKRGRLIQERSRSNFEQLCAALGILEDRLVGPYILGDDFTVGDLNLASTLREPGEDGISGIAAMDPVPFPNVGRWLVAVRGLQIVA
jgi:glutathione S-transferase